MTAGQLFRVAGVGLLLWAGVFAAGTCLPEAVADEPIQFETEREETYWRALTECNRDLDVAERRLEGEREKVHTTTTTINLSCPAPIVPACPPCPECGGNACLVPAGLGAGAGVLLTGTICGLLFLAQSQGGADVVIAR